MIADRASAGRGDQPEASWPTCGRWHPRPWAVGPRQPGRPPTTRSSATARPGPTRSDLTGRSPRRGSSCSPSALAGGAVSSRARHARRREYGGLPSSGRADGDPCATDPPPSAAGRLFPARSTCSRACCGPRRLTDPGRPPRRPRHASGRSGVLPRRSGARSAAAGFPGAEGIALARPCAAPPASSEWTGFLWHPSGPGRRGSAPRPRSDPTPTGPAADDVLPAPSERGPAGGALFCDPGQMPGGRRHACSGGRGRRRWPGPVSEIRPRLRRPAFVRGGCGSHPNLGDRRSCHAAAVGSWRGRGAFLEGAGPGADRRRGVASRAGA